MAVRRRRATGVIHPAQYIPVAGGLVRAPRAPVAQAPAQTQAQLAPDSEYFAGAARRQFDLTQGLAANDAEATQLVTARDEALRRLGEQQPKDEYASRISANKSGLLNSTTLGNSLSDLAQSYIRQRGDVQSSYDTQERARIAARKALEEGAPLDDAAARAEAADRQIGRDSESASSNSLVPNAPTVASRSVPKVTPKILKSKRRRVTIGRIRPTSTIIR